MNMFGESDRGRVENWEYVEECGNQAVTMCRDGSFAPKLNSFQMICPIRKIRE